MDGFLDQNTGFLPPTTAAAAALAIGGSITSGTAGRVLFEGAGPVLSDAAGFTYATTSGVTMSTDDAATATSLVLLSLEHTSSGTAAAGFGTGILFKAESAGGTSRSIGQLDSILTTATDAAEVSAIVLKTAQAGALVETVRIGGIAPAVDLQAGFGRCLLHSPTTDQATFSHRGRTETNGYAIRQLSTGATTVNALSGATLILANSNNTKMTVDSTGVSFFGGATVAKQTGPVLNITNSVTSGGTDGTIANYTDLSVYANDAAAIRNDIYQLARAVKFCSDALRAYGLLT